MVNTGAGHGEESQRSRGQKLSKLASVVGFVATQTMLIGYWGYTISEFGFDSPGQDFTFPMGAFIVMVVLIGPPAVAFGIFDAVARLLGNPLVGIVNGLLIASLAPVWIIQVTAFMFDDMGRPLGTAAWQTCLGLFLGQEFSLALLVMLSVVIRRFVRRQQSRDAQ